LLSINAATPLRILRIVEPSSYDYTSDFDYLKKAVKAYESKYPDVKVQEYLCDFKELRQALEFGNADLVFTEDFGIREIPNISLRLLNHFRLYIAVSIQSPLAQSEALDPDTLCNETLYTLPTLADEQDDIQTQLAACRLVGFTPKRVEFVSNFQTLLHAISHGKGICFCPKLKASDLRMKSDIIRSAFLSCPLFQWHGVQTSSAAKRRTLSICCRRKVWKMGLTFRPMYSMHNLHNHA
jgi:DNA-binding transcriptional LysR family regulator